MSLIQNEKLVKFLKCKMPDYWQKIIYSALKKAEMLDEIPDETLDLTYKLIKEYEDKGYISRYILCELMDLPDIVVILFYSHIYGSKGFDGTRPSSILQNENNYNWVMQRDYCFFNIRATGREISDTGDIMSSVKLFPALRVTGIHLAPFFQCQKGIVYCQNSFHMINEEIVNSFYLNEGVSPKEQIDFFIDCAHLLNIAVGFDFTPHTANMSKLSLDEPNLFRWIRLNKNSTKLYGNMDINEQYSELYQEKFQYHIRQIVENIKEELGIKKIDDAEMDYKLSNKAQAIARQVLREEGYYTVPPQTWNGICVPGFSKYNYLEEWPIWDYRDINGEDQGKHAIVLHASFYIHKGMFANKLPEQVTKDENDSIVKRNEEVLNFIEKYLSDIITLHKFDYIRMDYVDHIFDNVQYINGEEIPINEMLTPEEIFKIISNLRANFLGLGLQADRTGNDVDFYKKAGFNLVLGTEAKSILNKKTIEDIIIDCKNQTESEKSTCKALFTIDTHDIAHPLFLGKELVDREGKKGVITRLFMSRFLNVGENRRPKYEVIGNQDLSTGIHRANNKPESLIWGNNIDAFFHYHKMEDLYMSLKDKLSSCCITTYNVGNYHALWILENKVLNVQWLCVIPIICSEGINLEEERFRINTTNLKHIDNKKVRLLIDFEEHFFDHSSKYIDIKWINEKEVEISIKSSIITMIEFNGNNLKEDQKID